MPSKVVLLVEDTPADEELTRRALERARIDGRIVVAHDGVEALDYLFCDGVYAGREPCIQPEVVLLDLKLPRIDGLEVLRRLRQDERTRTLPVVVLTSSDEDRDVRESYRLGANSYICKPVDSERFEAAVRRLAHYWTRLNQPVPHDAEAQPTQRPPRR
jgi:CheY-like chemotaxis protein